MSILRLDDDDRALVATALRDASEAYATESDNAFDDGDDDAAEKLLKRYDTLQRIAKQIDGASGVLIDG